MDEVLVKEEGVITEYDSASGMGKVKSLNDGSIYLIDRRGSLSIGTELRPGDKVFFAPIEDASGADYARIIKRVGLSFFPIK